MTKQEFITDKIMPVVIGVIAEVCKKRGLRTFTYNARKDEPQILGKVNAALYALRDKIDNRHETFGANIVMLGSLNSVSADKLKRGNFRERTVGFLADLITNRADVAKRLGLTVAKVRDLSDEKLVAAFRIVNGGSLNIENYGFYQNSEAASSKYRSATASALKSVISKSTSERGCYDVSPAKAETAFKSVEKYRAAAAAEAAKSAEKKSAEKSEKASK